MIKISKDSNPNYLAQIVKLNKQVSHPNAEKLTGWIINGNRVWTDFSFSINDVVVYFPLECEINKDLLSNLNLFRNSELNKDKEKTGYFEANARVRAVKLRGEPSEGIIIHLSEILDGGQIKESWIGQKFDTIGEILICKKYVPKITRTPGKPGTRTRNKKVKDLIVDGQFNFHKDTLNLRHYPDRINPEDIISLTYKLHGTSFVSSKVIVNKRLNWFQKLFKKWINTQEYQEVWSSRKVIKGVGNKTTDSNHFYETDIWSLAHQSVKHALVDGLTLYGEVVGYIDSEKMIQNNYDYGCNPSQFETYIYRITYTNPQGIVFEFSWQQIKDWCNKYQIKHVPELYYGKASDFLQSTDEENFREQLQNKLTELFLEKDCSMCINKVPAEGICIRSENKDALKLKSFRFLKMESEQLDSDEINIEDNESNDENSDSSDTNG